MDDKSLALVPGGDGAAGDARLIGIIAGLCRGGVDLTEIADLAIGTSAGANAVAAVQFTRESGAELIDAALCGQAPASR